jgi:hypothetical protein
MVAHERNYIVATTVMDHILALAKKEPRFIWSDDIPAAVVAKAIFARLVASSGANLVARKVYIANSPGE